MTDQYDLVPAGASPVRSGAGSGTGFLAAGGPSIMMPAWKVSPVSRGIRTSATRRQRLRAVLALSPTNVSEPYSRGRALRSWACWADGGFT